MLWKVLLLVVISVFFAAACSSRTAPSEPTEAAPLPTSTQATQATQVSEPARTSVPTPTSPAPPQTQASEPKVSGVSEQPADGGTLVRLGGDPPTLDPHLTTDATSATYIVEVFGGLLTIDPQLNIVPDIAESYEVTGDGRIYTFHLRKNATFHSGKPVTAHDFKWSLERASTPATAAPVVDQYLGDIVGVNDKLNGDATEVSGIRVIDDYTLEITIDEPKSYFLAKLTYPTAFVLDKDNVESSRRWFREPNGTGPFKLAEYVPGETLVLARNENYHLGSPLLATVEFILSGGTAMLMYENDEIHLTGVGLADLDLILDPTNPLNSELNRAPPAFSTDYIGMNRNYPPFDDPKVRQALNYAIDKEAIARDVLAGMVVPAKGILPPGFPGYNPDLSGYEFNPEKARQLLSESKYGPDLENLPPIILTVSGSFGSSVGLDMEVILEMWRDILGVEVEIQQTEFATYLQDLVKRRFEMFHIGWIADYPDPENFLDLLFHTESSNNHTAYTNPEVDRLLEMARVEPQEEVRHQLYHQAEEMIVSDAPWIPLWYSGEQFVLIKPYVQDYKLTQLIIPKLRFVHLTEK